VADIGRVTRLLHEFVSRLQRSSKVRFFDLIVWLGERHPY